MPFWPRFCCCRSLFSRLRPGLATAFDTCGNASATVSSNPATTFGDPINFVTLTSGTNPISMIQFSGGAIDDLTAITGPGALEIAGGSTFTAHNVMFYIPQGSVSIHCNATVDITPPDEGDYYADISFFQARDNSDRASFGDGGDNTGINALGTFYFPVAQVTISGTPTALSNGLIALRLWLNGTPGYTIDYKGPPGDNPIKVSLVE